MGSVIWRTSALSLGLWSQGWGMHAPHCSLEAWRLGSPTFQALLGAKTPQSLVWRVSCSPHRKVSEKAPQSDSRPKLQAQESLPTSVPSALCLHPEGGVPSWAPPGIMHGEMGAIFHPGSGCISEQSVIKKDKWQVISVPNTCIVRRDPFAHM